MIKIENGSVHVKGTKSDILSDLSCIIYGLKIEMGIDEADLRHAVDIAFMNETELMESLDHALDELIDVLTKKFDDKEEK